MFAIALVSHFNASTSDCVVQVNVSTSDRIVRGNVSTSDRVVRGNVSISDRVVQGNVAMLLEFFVTQRIGSSTRFTGYYEL